MRIENLFVTNDAQLTFKAGQTIFKEGERGDVMYILLQGVVDVIVGEKVVGSFEPVEIIGEMAVIDPQPRSATVVAKTDCRLACINQRRFTGMVQTRPEFALQIMRNLVERIRWMDEAARDQAAAKGPEQSGKVAQLEAKIKELNATIQAQAEEISLLEQQLDEARDNQTEAAMA